MKHLLLSFIWIYRKLISPFIAPRCRYLPTCSTYARDAITEFGATKGSWLSIKRIARCHPWGGHGYDPLPNNKSEK